MRLDHLLSKEHLGAGPSGLVSRAISSASVRRWLLMGGTLTTRHDPVGVVSTALRGVERGVQRVVSGTLLGV